MLPTPTATSYGRNKGGSSPDGPERPSLSTMARSGRWPTPRASDGAHGGPNQRGSKGDLALPAAVVKWATPTVCGNYNRKGVSAKSGDGLATQVGGQLSPVWVEWLMGFPLAWTDCGRSATRRFRRWLRLHSIC